MGRENQFVQTVQGLTPLILSLIGVGVLVFLAARLADVLLLVFASILLAMLLHAIAGPFHRRARLSRTSALIAALLIMSLAAGLILWLLGTQIVSQLSSLSSLLPKSWAALEARLSTSALGAAVLGQVRPANWPSAALFGWLTRMAGSTASALAGAVIIIFAGSYLAFHPETYARGALSLIPRHHRARGAEVLEACRVALTQWLIGQVLSMIFIAVTTSIGLWLIGVPSPLALGLLAGAGHMVPVVGPWITALPGLVIAGAQGPQTFGWALALYFVTSQLESNFLTPLVMRQMAQLPMAITMFAVIAMGVLLGPLGVLLATPLAVVGYILVRKLYLEDVLGERLDPPPLQGSPSALDPG